MVECLQSAHPTTVPTAYSPTPSRPPVAVAAYAASSIAEDNPLLIAVMAVKFALAAFIVPFAFVYGPELLMLGSWHLILVSTVTAAAGLILIAGALEAYFHRHLVSYERVLLGVAGIGLIIPNLNSAGASVFLMLAYGLYQHFFPRTKV